MGISVASGRNGRCKLDDVGPLSRSAQRLADSRCACLRRQNRMRSALNAPAGRRIVATGIATAAKLAEAEPVEADLIYLFPHRPEGVKESRCQVRTPNSCFTSSFRPRAESHGSMRKSRSAF